MERVTVWKFSKEEIDQLATVWGALERACAVMKCGRGMIPPSPFSCDDCPFGQAREAIQSAIPSD